MTAKKVVSKKRSRQAAPGFNRLFINLGKTDSFFPSDLIGLLNSNTRGRIELGRIDLMQNYSFFEVPEKEATNVIKALNRAKWNGRKVVVEIAGAGEENGLDLAQYVKETYPEILVILMQNEACPYCRAKIKK